MNFLKQFIRNFWRQKQTSLLSVGGLSIGIATSLLIGWWCINEYSYDKFHTDADSIYRVCRKGNINNETINIGACFGPVAKTAKETFPEIQETVRVVSEEVSEIEANHVKGKDLVFLADSNFFKFFSYELIAGDINSCMTSPSSIILTEDMQRKYFGNNNCMGEIVKFNDKNWTVTAVMKNTPSDSHLQFDCIASLAGIPWLDNMEWGSSDRFLTYFKLSANTNTELLTKNLLILAHDNLPLLKEIDIHYFLQPLTDIHFDTENFRFDIATKGDERFTLILAFMALAILTIACINFTNLFISTSFLRSKSIAVKKSNGASRISLIAEFFAETLLYVLLSLFIGFNLALSSVPLFNKLANSNISFSLLDLNLYGFLGIIGISTVVVAGILPALTLSNLNIVSALKGKANTKGVSGFQKGLVIVQFAASIILLITMITIKKQIHFVQHADLGFDKENVVYIDGGIAFSNKYKTVKQELEKSPFITEVTAKSCLPMGWNSGNPVSVPEAGQEPFIMEVCDIKANYFDVFKMPLVTGDELSINHEGSGRVWINQSAVKILQLDNPIGKELDIAGDKVVVKGVVRDAKTKSLHTRVDPQIYIPVKNVKSYFPILIKIKTNQSEALKLIEQQWAKLNPNMDFEYGFLDEEYAQLYEREMRAGKLVSWGMFIALFITAIGLIAMANYTTQRRTKEIGVRKVNGAKIHEIVRMLAQGFLIWVVIAFIVATPISYLITDGWLSNFAYKTELSWWIFALAGITALGIALLTVSWQSWRAATRNPVEALRYE